MDLARPISELCGAPHSLEVLLLLLERRGPLATKNVMEGVKVRNWTTIAETLRTLRQAGVVVMEERAVGHYRSKAKFWALEPSFGTKVATKLQEVDQLLGQAEAAGLNGGADKASGRRGIVDVESAGEKLVTVVQSVMKVARG